MPLESWPSLDDAVKLRKLAIDGPPITALAFSGDESLQANKKANGYVSKGRPDINRKETGHLQVTTSDDGRRRTTTERAS